MYHNQSVDSMLVEKKGQMWWGGGGSEEKLTGEP